MSPRLRRLGTRALLGLCALFGLLIAVHVVVRRSCRIEAPVVRVPEGRYSRGTGVRSFEASFVLNRRGLLEVHLRGDPIEIGYAQARLLYPEMVENEGVLFDSFREAVPTSLLRYALLDLAQIRYRNVANGFSADRRAEIAAGALAFQPDPYADMFPTFQRFAYLNALYDIALSFEHSPLVGCTTFVFSGDRAAGGGSILARAFDFEIDIFDRRKAVFFVRETGKIPFASVAWPGLVGVVSGMNLEGVAVVVHGGRAGETRTEGEPVVHALRRVLSTARTTDEALRALSEREPLVSHILILTDGAGHAVRVERVPGKPNYVVPLATAEAVTNHFVGPAATDPKNLAVRDGTSTVPRKKRADELVRGSTAPLDAAGAVALLRDRRGEGGRELPLGDRRAIDALIATHGVVMDTGRRVLWVSEAPHLLGRFVAFDLTKMLVPEYDAWKAEFPSVPADELLTSGSYSRHQGGQTE